MVTSSLAPNTQLIWLECARCQALIYGAVIRNECYNCTTASYWVYGNQITGGASGS
jgi:hypothetical protein